MAPFLIAQVVRNDTGERLTLEKTRKRGKMHMFRLKQDHGESICRFLDDCGEFRFEWKSRSGVKTWWFYSEDNRLIGSASFYEDRQSRNEFLARQRAEQQAAWEVANG